MIDKLTNGFVIAYFAFIAGVFVEHNYSPISILKKHIVLLGEGLIEVGGGGKKDDKKK